MRSLGLRSLGLGTTLLAAAAAAAGGCGGGGSTGTLSAGTGGTTSSTSTVPRMNVRMRTGDRLTVGPGRAGSQRPRP